METQDIPLNTQIVVVDTTYINVTATRISEEKLEVVYKNPSNSAIVLHVQVGAP